MQGIDDRSVPAMMNAAMYGGLGMPMMAPMQGGPPRPEIQGPPGVQSYQSPPYVLVPTSALQFIPGYAQQMAVPQGGQGHRPGPYGGFPELSEQHQAAGRARFGRPGRPSSTPGSASPTYKTSEPSGNVNALAENLQSLSFMSPDGKSVRPGRGRKLKRPGVEELEEARLRTIYVSDLSKGITETELVRWFSTAGHVLECRICSDMNTTKRFAFVEFADKPGFDNGLAMSGEKLSGNVIKVSPSKTPIVPINRDFMPRDDKELERCERTVYVNQIDRAVPSSAVEAMFENFCGAIEHVKMKLDKQHNTRIAFIEFKSSEAAKTALGLCGAQLGSSQIRVSPSKTPVRVHAA